VADMPTPGREAAHILLDCLSVHNPLAPNPSFTVNLAYRRINEVQAVTASLTEMNKVHVDMSHLLGGTLVTMNWLLESLAAASGHTRHDLIVEVRQFLDEP
jgi:hypothetical protein